MNVLITGGAGFIGSHLAEGCLKKGWRVSVLDDLSTGSLANVESLKDHPGFALHIDSVLNRALITKLVMQSDYVYHLAAAVGVFRIMNDPIRTIENNVHGTEAVLTAAASARTPVIVASTSEVYGKSNSTPFREDSDLVLGPTTKTRWSYASSKVLDEFLALAYFTQMRVPATVVRFFNIIGPRQSAQYGMVLPTFVRQALRNQDITVFGSGEQRRCFGYVGDVVEALMKLVYVPQAAGEVINIGNDREITINDLAQLVKKTTGSASRIRHVPYDRAYGSGFEDMTRRVPSLEKLESLTGCRPRTEVEKVTAIVAEYERLRLSTASRPPTCVVSRAELSTA